MHNFHLLISTYHGAFLHPAGGEEELKILANSFQELGVTVDMYGPNSKPIDAYDAVLHFGTNLDGLAFVQAVKKANVKLFLWPNLWWSRCPDKDSIDSAQTFFNLADKIFFKSKAEKANNSIFSTIATNKTFYFPAFVSKAFYKINNKLGDQFKKLYGLENYLLWVGVIQESKNQLHLIKALKDFGLPLVFIGGVVDGEYFNECKKYSASKNIFIPNIPHDSDLLLGAISGCSMYVELSAEPAGLSALEAGVAGKTILLHNSDWTTEHFNDHVATIDDPNNYIKIRELIKGALSSPPPSDEMSNALFKKHCDGNIVKKILNAMVL